VVKVASINELAISYLRAHLADALIAATAWKKNLEVVITSPRHFTPIAEIHVRRFPKD
jgi:predicted nucleic acid-binding protein